MSKCNTCPFKCNIPGDAHISCGHPVFTKNQDIAIKVSIGIMLGYTNSLKDTLGLSFNSHGVSNGWCNFPVNYDPIWVEGDCKLLASYEKSQINVGSIGHFEPAVNQITKALT